MNYEEFLLNISRDNNFKIIGKRYNEESFGNFEIILLFANKIKIEINNDRGIIEINLNLHKILSQISIPLCFVINSLNTSDYCQSSTFDSLEKVQELLFSSLPILTRIIEENLTNEIIRKWKRRSNKQNRFC